MSKFRNIAFVMILSCSAMTPTATKCMQAETIAQITDAAYKTAAKWIASVDWFKRMRILAGMKKDSAVDYSRLTNAIKAIWSK